MDEYETHILVVDDDRRLRELLQRFLRKEGYMVTAASDASEARKFMEHYDFDLLIVDVMMPGETGMELTRHLRKSTMVPILMLTAMAESEARIEGLRAGADDYLPKPFEPEELLLRIQSIMRRVQQMRPETSSDDLEEVRLVHLGDAIFDPERETLTKAGQPIRLTTAEIALLKVMGIGNGRIFTREELTQACDVDGGDRAVDVQVTRLRRKIETDPKNPQYLHTIRGRGYALRPD